MPRTNPSVVTGELVRGTWYLVLGTKSGTNKVKRVYDGWYGEDFGSAWTTEEEQS